MTGSNPARGGAGRNALLWRGQLPPPNASARGSGQWGLGRRPGRRLRWHDDCGGHFPPVHLCAAVRGEDRHDPWARAQRLPPTPESTPLSPGLGVPAGVLDGVTTEGMRAPQRTTPYRGTIRSLWEATAETPGGVPRRPASPASPPVAPCEWRGLRVCADYALGPRRNDADAQGTRTDKPTVCTYRVER